MDQGLREAVRAGGAARGLPGMHGCGRARGRVPGRADLVRSLDDLPFAGGAILTGHAPQQVAERGFGSAAGTGLDRPRRAVVLMTEARSQDQVAGPASFARAWEPLLLGVGSEAVRADLEEVTGSPARVMIDAGPEDLCRQIPKLRGKLCSQQRPGKDQSCTGASCGPASPDPGAGWPVAGPSSLW